MCQRVKERRQVPIRFESYWAVGFIPDWADWLPDGLFLFFYFFFSFLFSDFLIIP
jgi:hypothetical protein